MKRGKRNLGGIDFDVVRAKMGAGSLLGVANSADGRVRKHDGGDKGVVELRVWHSSKQAVGKPPSSSNGHFKKKRRANVNEIASSKAKRKQRAPLPGVSS